MSDLQKMLKTLNAAIAGMKRYQNEEEFVTQLHNITKAISECRCEIEYDENTHVVAHP